jgi:hypothetical protein
MLEFQHRHARADPADNTGSVLRTLATPLTFAGHSEPMAGAKAATVRRNSRSIGANPR